MDTTDQFGYFEFNHLPAGNYSLFPDISGIPIDTVGWSNINITGADTETVYFLADSNIIFLGDSSVLTDIKSINHSDVKIWPNPVGDKLFVQSEVQFESINIYNTQGQELRVLTTDSKGLININTSNIKPGIYILELRTRNKQALVRFIKK